MKDFIEEALHFIGSEDELRIKERLLHVLLSDAIEKSALDSANMISKGLTKNLRYRQIEQRFSANSKVIREAAKFSLEKYNKLAKEFLGDRSNNPPILNDRVKESLLNVMSLKLQKKDKQKFKIYDTTADLCNTDEFMAVFDVLLNHNQ